ncbi:hypothetical protein RRG08_047763 [Elysia crispata]|uniref:Uncharacterized protein n=1 Tax=Elysia crispata TaxID=231223 RepID=A0AAE0YX77_9GAST|nr:hypothetical protein RRG08_047763 [Elysia crispata]
MDLVKVANATSPAFLPRWSATAIVHAAVIDLRCTGKSRVEWAGEGEIPGLVAKVTQFESFSDSPLLEEMSIPRLAVAPDVELILNRPANPSEAHLCWEETNVYLN